MKKRLAVLFAVCALVLTCSLTAFAAVSFDEDAVKNAQDIAVYQDESCSYTAYQINSILQQPTWHAAEEGGAAFLLTPEITTYRDKGGFEFVLNFWHENFADEPLTVQSITLEAGGHKYTFNNIEASVVGTFESGSGKQFAMSEVDVTLVPGTLTLMDDINADRNAAVKVTYTTSEGELSYYLSQQEKDSMIHLYNLYAQAGGLSSENIKAVSAE